MAVRSEEASEGSRVRSGASNLISEFKAFALSGNVFDLAIGIVIGVAFGAVVDSFVTDVLMQAIAAVFGKPDFSDMVFHLDGSAIRYGKLLTAALNFLIIAGVLLALVKLLIRFAGMNFRAQGNRECPYCKEYVAVDATRCKFCTSELEQVVKD